MNALLLVAWVWAALQTAWHIGAQDFSWGFWLNAALMLGIPVVGIIASRSNISRKG